MEAACIDGEVSLRRGTEKWGSSLERNVSILKDKGCWSSSSDRNACPVIQQFYS